TRAVAARIIERTGLAEHTFDPAGSLPLGKQRIAEVARALAADPVLLMLDEPAAGLRYREKQELARLLRSLKQDGMTILLDVPEGSIVTVIGPNGAGKTTLLSAIIGLLPSRGEIGYANGATSLLSVEQRVAAGIVLVPEKRELFASMTVAENLELGAFARR